MIHFKGWEITPTTNALPVAKITFEVASDTALCQRKIIDLNQQTN